VEKIDEFRAFLRGLRKVQNLRRKWRRKILETWDFFRSTWRAVKLLKL
jgi:hypothetical protein